MIRSVEQSKGSSRAQWMDPHSVPIQQVSFLTANNGPRWFWGVRYSSHNCCSDIRPLEIGSGLADNLVAWPLLYLKRSRIDNDPHLADSRLAFRASDNDYYWSSISRLVSLKRLLRS